MSSRCSDLSLAAGESLVATATTADRWLLIEVRGPWPRDVAAGSTLPAGAREAVSRWLEETPRSRLQFVRRPGRSSGRLRVFVVRAEADIREVSRIELRTHGELAAVDLATAGDPVEHSLVLVCGHGSRDRCCALHGTDVYTALRERLGPEELWISSHQGGHRFAANLLVLPAGLQFGRVEPAEASFLVARALSGRIELGRFRGRTCYEPPVQAAEHAVRATSGLEGVADLRLEDLDSELVRFRAWSGEEHLARVEETEGPVVPPSCGADPEPQRAFHVELM